MSKSKSIKSGLLTSAVALILCVAMLVGTTFAWFTDSVTSANNVIQSGNLDIVLEYWDGDSWEDVAGKSDILTNTLWEPGVAEVAYLRVANAGSLALKYQLGINIVSETAGVNVAGDEFLLSDYLQFGVVEGVNGETGAYADRDAAVDAVTNAKALNAGYTKADSLAANTAPVYLALVVYMPTEVGNVANHNGTNVPVINLGINVLATQVAAENDSFGPDYDEDAWHPEMKVNTAADLQAALNNGVTNIVLENDITLTESLVIPAAATTYSMRTNATVIDLNGKTLTGSMHKNVGSVIKNEGNLVLKNGTVSSTGANGGSAILNKGTAVLENVTLNGAPNADGSWPSYAVNNNAGVLTVNNSKITSYHGAVASYGEGAIVTLNNSEIDMAGIPGFTSHGVYTYNDGKVIVNSGTYANKAADQNSTGASVINGNVEINGGSFSGRIENYYGNPVIKGGTFSVKPNAKFVASGFEAVANENGTFTFVFPQESLDSLIENAGENATIEIPAGEYSFPASDLKAGQTLICAPGTVFEGTSSLDVNGATVIGATFDAGDKDTSVSGIINGTFKNCTFTGASEGVRWCYTSSGTTTVFENCVFDATLRGIHFDDMVGDVKFINCEINGFNAYGGAGTATFEGCTFGNDASKYNGLNIYANTVLTDCTFNFVSGKTNFIDMEGDGKTLTITNCTATLDGASVSVLEFVGGSKLANNTVIIDGKKFVVAETLSAVMAAAREGNVIIDAKGANLGDFNYNGTFGNGTVLKNATFTYVYGASVDGVATFENCNFVSDHSYSANFSDGSYTGKVIFNNCYFDGWSSFGDAITGVEMNNCTFDWNNPYSMLRFYQNAVLNNCNFIDIDGIDTNKTGTVVEFNNCTGIEGKIHNNTEGGVVKVGTWIVDGTDISSTVTAW